MMTTPLYLIVEYPSINGADPATQAPRTGAKTPAAAPVARALLRRPALSPSYIAPHGVSPHRRAQPFTQNQPNTPPWHLFEPLGSQDFLK